MPRSTLFLLTSVFVPWVVIATAVASKSAWMLWVSVVFAGLIILVVAASLLRDSRSTKPLMPLSLLVLAIVVSGIASPGATTWLLWPLLLAVIAAVALEYSGRRERRRSTPT